jgi:hypothetical protein
VQHPTAVQHGYCSIPTVMVTLTKKIFVLLLVLLMLLVVD